MIIADTLCSAHLAEVAEEIPEEEMEAQIHMVFEGSAGDDLMEEIKLATLEDPSLQEVIRYTKEGWPDKKNISETSKKYISYREELAVINGTLFKGERVVVPEKLRHKVLNTIHLSHMGIEKTKLRARTSVYWPGVNNEIEKIVKSCNACL